MSGRTITEYVLNIERYDMALTEFVEAVNNAVARIPAEHIHRAKVSFSSREDDPPELDIYYVRPETAEDVAKREAEYAAILEINRTAQERRERGILAALKAKYEK